MTLDSAQLAALNAALVHGSFEQAARVLHVSASAISQRIARLENRVGEILLLRSLPIRATAAGQRLAIHAEQIAALEASALADLSASATSAPTRLTIAVNADSLASWFPDVLADLTGLYLSLVLDNEDQSADWLRRGEVAGAVASEPAPMAGCTCDALGTLRYRAVASPAFMARYLSAGVTAASVAAAPSLSFNTADRLQARWLARYLGAHEPRIGHRLPSSEAFIAATRLGCGWSVNPACLVDEDIARGTLVELMPDSPLDIMLYWHSPQRMRRVLEPLTRRIKHAARAQLRPVDPAPDG